MKIRQKVAQPGRRHYLRLRNPERFIRWQQSETTQAGLPGVNSNAIRRLEHEECVREQTAQRVHRAVNDKGWTISFRDLFAPCASDGGKNSYSWKEMVPAAERAARKLKAQKFRPDVVLTFPAGSSIFSGLLLSKMFLGCEALRIPTHTALCVSAQIPMNAFPEYEPVPTETGRFKILLPLELGRLIKSSAEPKQILVADDCIITGIAMKALRKFYSEHSEYGRSVVKFACGVCYRGVARLKETAPDAIGKVHPLDRFTLPWGPAFAFEDCFKPMLTTTK